MVLGLIFIFATGKIAAYFGFVAGVLFYAIKKRNLKTVILILIGGIGIVYIYTNLDKIAPSVHARIELKIQDRIVKNVDGTSENDFFTTNWGNAIKTFEEIPLTGSGLGGFAGNFHKNEVHSTYLKMLAETGLIGTLGYCILMLMVFYLFKKPKFHKKNIYYDYFR